MSRIAIYTASEPSLLNRFNIGKLLKDFSNDEFLFVIVKKQRHPQSLPQRIKALLSKWIKGPNQFEVERKALEKRIAPLMEPYEPSNYAHVEVAQVNDLASEEALRAFDPDFIVQAGAGILKANIFTLAKKGTLNVHHGYAPEIRGIQSNFWCMYYGLTEFIGVTCHIIDAQLDTGEVIAQYRHEYQPGETLCDVQFRIAIEGAKLLQEGIVRLRDTPNPVYETTEVTSYYFSNPAPQLYKDLKNNQYMPLGSREGRKTKIKPKKVFVVKS